MATNPPPVKPPPPFQPLAAVLAWVLPGAGHFYLGHVRRGTCIACGILFLFATGLFIGGISSIDRRENFFWFLGQSLNGPVTLGIDYIHQSRFKAYEDPGEMTIGSRMDLARIRYRSAYPYEVRTTRTLKVGSGTDSVTIPVFRRVGADAHGEGPPYTRSLGRAGELGTLFITIGGFMNLICIIDAAWRRKYDAADEAVAAELEAANRVRAGAGAKGATA